MYKPRKLELLKHIKTGTSDLTWSEVIECDGETSQPSELQHPVS